jgi:hypothetical protein
MVAGSVWLQLEPMSKSSTLHVRCQVVDTSGGCCPSLSEMARTGCCSSWNSRPRRGPKVQSGFTTPASDYEMSVPSVSNSRKNIPRNFSQGGRWGKLTTASHATNSQNRDSEKAPGFCSNSQDRTAWVPLALRSRSFAILLQPLFSSGNQVKLPIRHADWQYSLP